MLLVIYSVGLFSRSFIEHITAFTEIISQGFPAITPLYCFEVKQAAGEGLIYLG
jgi:hypothetical protein